MNKGINYELSDKNIKIIEDTDSLVYKTESGYTPLKLRELSLAQQFAEAAAYTLIASFKDKRPYDHDILSKLIEYEINATKKPSMQAVKDAFGRRKYEEIVLKTELDKMKALIKHNPLALKDIKNHYKGNGNDFVNLLKYINNPRFTCPERYKTTAENLINENENKPFDGVYIYSDDKSDRLPSFAYTRTKQYNGLDRYNRTLETIYQKIMALARNKKVNKNDFMDFALEFLRKDDDILPFDINAFTLGYHMVGSNFMNNESYKNAYENTIKMMLAIKGMGGENKYKITHSKSHQYEKITNRKCSKFVLELQEKPEDFLFNHPIEFRVQMLPVDIILPEMSVDLKVPGDVKENEPLARTIYLARRSVNEVNVIRKDGKPKKVKLTRKDQDKIRELIGTQCKLFSGE